MLRALCVCVWHIYDVWEVNYESCIKLAPEVNFSLQVPSERFYLSKAGGLYGLASPFSDVSM